jgi:hypothetical protein
LIAQQAEEFEHQQKDAERRLLIITSSNSADEATRRLEGPLEKLRRVELAKQYVEMLEDVDKLVVDARRHLPQSPKDALRPYTQLKELSISLHRKQELAELMGTHLVDHVERTTDQLWVEMKKIMTDEFEYVTIVIDLRGILTRLGQYSRNRSGQKRSASLVRSGKSNLFFLCTVSHLNGR